MFAAEMCEAQTLVERLMVGLWCELFVVVGGGLQC